MSPKSALFFKVLLNRFHPGIGEAFLKPLPEAEVKEIVREQTNATDASAAIEMPKSTLEWVHYSWLAQVLQQMPKEVLPSVVAAFSKEQSSGLKRLMKLDSIPKSPPTPIKAHLLDQVYRRWNPDGVVPFPYISRSPLGGLLKLSKQDLVQLIDYLSLYDVAEAIRHIVDKNRLKTIYRCLTAKEQQFLRLCLHKKERIAAPKLDIDKWDGDSDKLRFILHRRGIFRLSKGIAGQTKEFLWYLVHKLDTGRGKAVEELYEPNELAGITPALVVQIKTVMDFIKEKSDT